MASRTFIRANGSILGAVIAAAVFGGLATFGLRIVTVAVSLGEVGLWVWGILAVTVLLLWGMIHTLWAAFGVALVISPRRIRRPGPFRGISLRAEGLRVGFYDTTRMRGGPGGAGAARASRVTEIWALCPESGAVLLMEAARGAPEVARIAQAVRLHLGRTPETMRAQGKSGFSA